MSIVRFNKTKNYFFLRRVEKKKHANLSYMVQLAYSAIIVVRVLSIFTRMFLHRIFKFIQSKLKTHITVFYAKFYTTTLRNKKKDQLSSARGAYTFFNADTHVC